jgi:D-sedoheptulose 7-phosphate isomerase
MSIRDAFEAHRRLVDESAPLLTPLLEQATQCLVDTIRVGGKVLVCGNGGSASDAQHFAAELVGRYRIDRVAFASVALSADTSALTAIGNDYGFEWIFARQVEALGRPGDVLVAISTSGNSANVVAAARAARERGLRVIGLTGRGGGLLAEHVDLLLPVPSQDTPRIQEVHSICLHVLAEAVETLLGGTS